MVLSCKAPPSSPPERRRSVATAGGGCPPFIAGGAPTATVDAAAGTAVLANNYLCVQLAPGTIASLRADFAGRGAYGRTPYVKNPRTVEH